MSFPNSRFFFDGAAGAIAGFIIVAIFLMLLIQVPLLLVDIIFTLAILLAFVPLMIGSIAYEDTREFSTKGIEALFGIAWRLIIYAIFLEIMFQSFMYIGDLYYPGSADGHPELDNFTYLFPGFMNPKANTALAQDWYNCYNDHAGNSAAIKSCLANLRIEYTLTEKDFSYKALMPVLGVGVITLMLMGNMKTYADIFNGYMLQIGDQIKGFITGSVKYVTSVSREFVGNMKKSYKGDG